MIDESSFKASYAETTKEDFRARLAKYDKQVAASMRARGYSCVHSMERTVIFTFGEISFSRKRWKRGKEWAVPVDDMLGLTKNSRYSYEFLYQIAKLSTMMPYDKVVQVIDLLYQVMITKPTVVKATKLAEKLLEEKKDYRFFNENNQPQKKPVDVIYIEGDGAMIKTKSEEPDKRNTDLSHFVVHTGSRQIEPKRFQLMDKKEFVSPSHRQARRELLDYLYNTYEIKDTTLLITNSDCGVGYTPQVFDEISRALGIIHHEHFWDAYHVHKELRAFFRNYPEDLQEQAFTAVKSHNRHKLKVVLDTVESMITDEKEQEDFENFKSRFLSRFRYTKPAKLRGLEPAGIGIMESQHRKITYRMKKRGMYWTQRGLKTMSQLIVLTYENSLEELFFGDWRTDYKQLIAKELETPGDIIARQRRLSKQYQPLDGRRKSHLPGLKTNLAKR
ncbi:ISLre2 family transposase [Streptococcus sobrinus]|uniref:ISLre2 family transposase n=1 Tax=Streptococcus sobrinus TaxID=1310 RepID=UPI0002E7D838|nr:ISLre2 family transposase [Streptococcus sobrinus]